MYRVQPRSTAVTLAQPLFMQALQLTPSLPAFAFDIFADWPLAAVVSTRHGGVSPPPWDTLNFSLARGDSRAAVSTNLARFLQANGFQRADIVMAGQIRADRIVRVTSRDRGQRLPGVDGLITDEPRLPLLTLYADCVPVVIYDCVRHVLGVCHAGWQGTTRRIAAKLLRELQRRFGTRAAQCLCALGPSIGPASYEVGPSVIQEVHASQRQPEKLLRPSARPAHAYLDLWDANRRQLLEAGVPPANVDVCGIDTAQRTDLFFSHRAEKGQCGLFGMLCWLEPHDT